MTHSPRPLLSKMSTFKNPIKPGRRGSIEWKRGVIWLRNFSSSPWNIATPFSLSLSLPPFRFFFVSLCYKDNEDPWTGKTRPNDPISTITVKRWLYFSVIKSIPFVETRNRLFFYDPCTTGWLNFLCEIQTRKKRLRSRFKHFSSF